MGPQPTAPAVSDSEPAYFQGIEEYFVSRRGDPLFLSNADWTLIRKWRAAGVPLRIVLRGIRDALDGHAHSWGRKRKVGSLAYCAAEVEVARERWHRALALGSEGTSAGEALRGFAEALETAPLGPRGRVCALEAAPLLRAWAAQGDDMRALEPRLQALESQLVEALRGDLGQSACAALSDEIEQELAPYKTRMPEKVLAQVRASSVARRVLEGCALPRLSLFHL
jgi:hypothetical protein